MRDDKEVPNFSRKKAIGLTISSKRRVKKKLRVIVKIKNNKKVLDPNDFTKT